MINLLVLAGLITLLLLAAFTSYRRQQQQLLQRQQRGLSTCCELLQLMNCIQQHRGVSSAALGGLPHQDQKLLLLQQQADRTFECSDLYLPPQDNHRWLQLKPRWLQLSQRWSDSTVLENFQFHCDILRELQILIQDLTDHSGLTSANDSQQRLLAQQIFIELPTVIEHIGQIRALSTYAATRNSCLTAFKLNLQYLIEQLRIQGQQLQQRSGRGSALNNEITSLLQLVDNEVIQPERLTIAPEQLFRSASTVMEKCYDQIDSGIKQLSPA